MNALVELDHFLFRLINRDGSAGWLDQFMPFWTDLHKNTFVFLPLLVLIIGGVWWKYRRNGLLVLAFAIAMGFLADSFSSHALKPLFLRPRPEFAHLPFEVLIRGPHYGGSSFPSSHALVFFCIVGILISFDRRLKWPLLFLGAVTAYSRVYCGAHFPVDVVGGALIGYWIGRLVSEIVTRFWPSGVAPIKSN